MKANRPNITNPVPLRSYNCGGFALGIYTWFLPRSWEDFVDGFLNELGISGVLRHFADGILEDFENLREVKSPRGIHRDKVVIGLRMETNEDTGWHAPDFHFIVRIDGEWYEKPGGWDIVPFRGSIFEPWCNAGSLVYDSEIIWFVQD